MSRGGLDKELCEPQAYQSEGYNTHPATCVSPRAYAKMSLGTPSPSKPCPNNLPDSVLEVFQYHCRCILHQETLNVGPSNVGILVIRLLCRDGSQVDHIHDSECILRQSHECTNSHEHG